MSKTVPPNFSEPALLDQTPHPPRRVVGPLSDGVGEAPPPRRQRPEFHPFTWLLGLFTAVLGYYAVKFDQTLSTLERQVVQVEQQLHAGRELHQTNLAHVTHQTLELTRNLQKNSRQQRTESRELQIRVEGHVNRLNERVSRLEGQTNR
ncbi:hypothetical protein [Acanthopleuribacter pedis]|uniref:Uncharacterized protein n=1 Tax=Acanthopleuribacter pedis TaxID=442870 RepID=A0A8J7U318_9BACT|nr:hypothetical protein [Acanthopleuribacter pedis]MBO1319908.1 hypothetical protein [Acanthopleuribacter pedis]